MVAVLEIMGNRNLDTGLEVEYKALNDEILQRLDIRNSINKMNMIFFASILALAGFKGSSLSLVLIYPPIATILATVWARNEYNLQILHMYIRTNLEPLLSGFGWEGWKWELRFKDVQFDKRFTVYIAKSEFMLFIFTQITTIVIWIFNFYSQICYSSPCYPSQFEYIMLGIDSVSLMAIIAIVEILRKEYSNAVKRNLLDEKNTKKLASIIETYEARDSKG